jgi:hypothetical protein
MKRLVFLSLIFFLGIGSANSQNAIGIGAAVGTNLLFGDSFISDSQLMPGFKVHSFYQIAPKFSLKLQAGYSEIRSATAGSSFKTTMTPIELCGIYSLSESPTFPFLGAGIGLMSFSTNNGSTSFERLISGGFGMNFSIDPNWSVVVSADFIYTTRDDFNGLRDGLNDGYFTFQTGFSYDLTGKKKRVEKRNTVPQARILAEGTAARINRDELYSDLIQLRSRIVALEKEIDVKNRHIEQLIPMIEDKKLEITRLEAQVASLGEPSR